MKTKCTLLILLAAAFFASAQDRTTVTAPTSEISDNLDLRAVASIFGDSENLDDFERRLNDPKMQISNLDLNNDNQVDYLRVIESVQGNTHLIILQSVIDRDLYQDVATIEVEKDRHNNIQVQVVGDTYMYGSNYIYEPVYVARPLIYSTFWVANYRPYYSSWYWGYYPTYYYAWEPCPVFRYRRNIVYYVNARNHYNYVTVRRSRIAANLYNGRRSNAYERRYPERSFERRHVEVANRYELDQRRPMRDVGAVRTPSSELPKYTPRNSQVLGTPRPAANNYGIRENNASSPRTSQPSPRTEQAIRPQIPAAENVSPRPQRSDANVSVRDGSIQSPRTNSNNIPSQSIRSNPVNSSFGSTPRPQRPVEASRANSMPRMGMNGPSQQMRAGSANRNAPVGRR